MIVDQQEQYEDMVKDALSQWGRWAKRDGSNRLWFMNRSPHLIDHNKYHEGEHPLEELVDRQVSGLQRLNDMARVALCLYYAYDEPGVGRLSWDDVAKKMQCSKPKVREAVKFALGFLVRPLLEFYGDEQVDAA